MDVFSLPTATLMLSLFIITSLKEVCSSEDLEIKDIRKLSCAAKRNKLWGEMGLVFYKGNVIVAKLEIISSLKNP